MSEYDNTNSGALFRNNKEVTEVNRRPTHTGSIETKCEHCQKNTQFWLSAWVAKSRAGQKFFSLKCTPKEERAETEKSEPLGGDFDDDIPFRQAEYKQIV